MNKSKSLVIIISSLLLCCLSFLGSYFFLKGIGVVAGSEMSIEVNISDSVFTYDGQEHYLNTAAFEIINGKLEQGHKIVISSNDTLINVGEKNCTFTVIVFDESGYDVSKRYNIRYNSPQIIVKPLPIIFKISSGTESIYNGQSISYDNITTVEGSLIAGHEYKPYVEGTVTNVGDKQESNKIINHIYDQAGNEVTKNYDITVVVGNLRVYPRQITIKPKDCHYEFDGNEKKPTEIEVVNGSLVPGHVITCEYNESFLLAGEFESVIKTFIIRDEHGNDVTNNYQVKTEVGTLTIDKKNLTVYAPNQSFAYDGLEHTCTIQDVEQIGLISGHVITNVVYTEYSKILNTHSAVNKIKSIEITNKDGDVLTECYNINYVNGELTLYNKLVTIEVPSETYEYDGESHFISDEVKPKVEGLIDGDELIYEYTGVIQDAGEVVNNLTNYKIVRKVNGINYDVTMLYDINIIPGKLKVIEAELVVCSPSKTYTYNGNEQKVDDSIEPEVYGLLEGDKLEWEYTSKLTTPDSILNIVKIKKIIRVVNGKEVDVLNNYNITYNYGQLTVEKAKVTITAASGTFDYNGESHSIDGNVNSNKPIVSGIIGEYELKVSYEGSQKDVGSSPNKVKIVSLINGLTNVNLCYDIELIDGTITVNPMKLELTAPNQEFTYNGEYQYCNKPITDVTFGSKTSLYSGHKLTEVIYTEDSYIFNTLESANKIERVVIKNELDEDVTHFYDITFKNGNLTLKKAEVTLTFNNNSVVYDGLSHTPEFESTGLLDGDQFDYTIEGSIIKPGNEDIKFNNFRILRKVQNKFVDVTSCYEIKVNGATKGSSGDIISISCSLEVTKRPLTITLEDQSFEYDGLSHSLTPEFSGLAEGHVISNTGYTSTNLTNVGSRSVSLSDVQITDENGLNVTSHYEIPTSTATLRVTKRSVEIIVPSKSFVYDGLSHSLQTSDTPEIIGLLDGHDLTYDYTGSKTTVGTEVASIDSTYTITNQSGDNVTSNYDVTITKGTITVTARPITITAASESFTYDGNVRTSNIHPSSQNLVSTDTVNPTYSGSYRNVGEYENGFETLTIINSSYENVTNCYDITVIPGVITITKADLHLEYKKDDGTGNLMDVQLALPYGVDVPYNGIIVRSNLSDIHNIRIVAKSFISVEDQYSPIGYARANEVIVYDVNNIDVTSNYNVIYEENTVDPITNLPTNVIWITRIAKPLYVTIGGTFTPDTTVTVGDLITGMEGAIPGEDINTLFLNKQVIIDNPVNVKTQIQTHALTLTRHQVILVGNITIQ